MASTDLKACFDHGLPAMVIPVSQQVGIPETATMFLYNTLWSQPFKVGMGRGISEDS